jgi:hypothetical protein
MVETQTEKKVKLLGTKSGMQFSCTIFNDYCNDEGIVRQDTITHTPQQNDVHDRMNRTNISKACYTLSNDGIDMRFGAEAASTTC